MTQACPCGTPPSMAWLPFIDQAVTADPVGAVQVRRGYADAQARQIFRDIVDMPATITVSESGVEVNFHRRSHLPIVIASGLLDKPITVPWWGGRVLRLTTNSGTRTP